MTLPPGRCTSGGRVARVVPQRPHADGGPRVGAAARARHGAVGGAASPSEFRQWFTAHSGRIRALMVPLGAGAALTGAASAVAQVTERHRSGPAAVVAAGAVGGVIAITVAVNEPANHRFVAGELTGPETTALLSRWARWHHVRVGLGLLATGAATLALGQQPDSGRLQSRRRRHGHRTAARPPRPPPW